jgi:hypothetical protein
MSASDMHRALEARKVKGTTPAVCELDSTQGNITVDRMAGFSSYHNFSYQPEGIVVSRAYGIGPGKLIRWNTLNIKCESLIIAKDSGNRKRFSSVIPRCITLPTDTVQGEQANVVDDASYQCNEPGCSYVTANFEALRDHVNFGSHELSTRDNEGIYDRLRREWAHKFATLFIEPVNRTSNIPVQSHAGGLCRSQGEAGRDSVRMSKAIYNHNLKQEC